MHRNEEEEDDDDILMIRYSAGGGGLPTEENGPSGATSEPSQGEDGSSGGSSGGGGDHHLVSAQHHHSPATPLADSDETRPSLVVSVRTLRATAASQRQQLRHHHRHYRNITLNSRNTTQITTTTITTTTTTSTPTTQSSSAAELNPSVFLERLLGSPGQILLGGSAAGNGGGGSGTSGGSGGGTSGAGLLTASGSGGNNGDHVHVSHHRSGVSGTIGGPSTSAASVVASLNQGNGQNNGGGGSTISNGAATLFRDATRVVVVDNGFNSIFSNSEDSGSIDLVDQAGYLFGRSLAATLNSTPPPLHWWLEEAKVLGLESQSDVCLTVCNSLIPKLEEQRSAEVAKSRGKRSKKTKDGETTKSQSQQTDPTTTSTVDAAASGTDEAANMAAEASQEAIATAAVVAAETAEASEEDDDENQQDTDEDEDEEEEDDDNNSIDDEAVADVITGNDHLVASIRANIAMVGSDRIAAAIDEALAEADSDDHSHPIEDDEDDDDEENPSEPGEMAGPEFLMQLDDAESSASDSGSLPESILSLSTVPSPRDAAGADEEDSDHHMVDLSGTPQGPIVVTLPLTGASIPRTETNQTNRSPGSGVSLTISSSLFNRTARTEDEDEEAMSPISDIIMEESSEVFSSDGDTSIQPTGRQNSQSSGSCVVVETGASRREPMVIDDEAANAPLPDDDDDDEVFEPLPGTVGYLVGGLLKRIQNDQHKMRYPVEVDNTPVPPTIVIDDDDDDDDVQIVFSTLPDRPAGIRRPRYIDPEIIELDSDDDEIVIADNLPHQPIENTMVGYLSEDDFFEPKSCGFEWSSDDEDMDDDNKDEYNTSDDEDEVEAEVVAATGSASDTEKDEERDTDMEGAVGGQIATTALVLPPVAQPARGFDRTSNDHHLIMQIPIHQPTSSTESGSAPTVRVVEAAAASISGAEIPDGVDPSFLAALPQEMREEVIAEHLR